MLVTSIFSFTYNVFFCIKDMSFYEHLLLGFEFGLVKILLFG